MGRIRVDELAKSRETPTRNNLRLFFVYRHTVGRMYVYDSTMSRLQSSGQLGVNDLAAFTKASCTGAAGRTRMLCFDFVLAGYYGWGVLGSFRASKLYDPADPDAAALAATTKGWLAFYRRFTKPRPSGAGGIFLGDLIHLRRPSSRDVEAALSVTADASAPERGVLTALNPTLEPLSTNITTSLYYAGIAPGAAVTVTVLTPGWQQACGLTNTVQGKHLVGQEGAGPYDITIPVDLKPSSYVVFLISLP